MRIGAPRRAPDADSRADKRRTPSAAPAAVPPARMAAHARLATAVQSAAHVRSQASGDARTTIGVAVAVVRCWPAAARCGGGSSSGPIMLDLVTPWLTAAIEQNFGSRYRVEVGGTQLERDAQGRTALRLRDIVRARRRRRDRSRCAPKAEVGISGTSLLIAQSARRKLPAGRCQHGGPHRAGRPGQRVGRRRAAVRHHRAEREAAATPRRALRHRRGHAGNRRRRARVFSLQAMSSAAYANVDGAARLDRQARQARAR